MPPELLAFVLPKFSEPLDVLTVKALPIGLVMVVFGSIVNLVAAFLYNLLAEFVGGIELTLTERR